jgi:hypothetical protein
MGRGKKLILLGLSITCSYNFGPAEVVRLATIALSPPVMSMELVLERPHDDHSCME